MNNTTNETSEIKNTGFLSRMSQIIKKYKLASTLAIGLGVGAGAGMVGDSLKNKNNSVMGNIPELLPTNKVERVIGSSLIGGKDNKTIEATQELISPGSTFNKSNIGAFMKAFPVGTSIQFIAPNSNKRNYGFIKGWSLGIDGEKGGATIEFLKTDGTRVTIQTGWGEENLKALKRFNFHDFNREFPFTFVGKGLNATQIAQKLGLNITYKDWPKIAGTIVSINGDVITNEYNIPANTHYVVAKNKLEAKFISEFLKTKIGASEPIVIKYPKDVEKKTIEQPKVKESRTTQVKNPKPQTIEKTDKVKEISKITPQEQKKNTVTFKINPETQDIRNALNNNSEFKQKFIKLFYPKARNMDKVAGHYSEGEKRMDHLDKVSIASKLKQDIEQFLKDAGLYKVTGEQLFKSVCRAESGGMLTEEIIQKYLETGNFGYVKSILHNNFTVNKQCKGSGQMQEGYIKDGARSFSEETGVNMKVSTANSAKIKETFGLLKKGVDPQVVLEKIKQIDSRFDTQKIINIILAKFKEISTSMQEKGINAKDSLYLATMAYSHGENFAEKVGNNFANHLKSNPKANLRNYLVAKGFSASSLDIVDRKIAHLEMYSKANTEAEKRIIETNQKIENSNTHIKETDLQTGESKVIKVDFQNKTRSENFSITNEANTDELPINQKVASILDKIQSNPSVQNIQELPKLSAADDYVINKTEYAKFVEKYKLTHNFTKEDIANLDSNKTKTIAAFESFVSSSKYDLSKETKILSDKFIEYYLLSQFGNDQDMKIKASENARNIIHLGKVALEKKIAEKKIESEKNETEKELMKISLKILPPVMHNLFELDVKNYLAKNPGHTHIQAVEYILEDNRAEIATYTGEKAPILLRTRNKELKHLLHELKKYGIDNSKNPRKHYISLVKEKKVA